MAYQKYPAWRYHPEKPACIVKDEEEDKALGADWTDTPTTTPPASTVPAAEEAEAAAVSERAKELYETNAKTAIEKIYGIKEVSTLEEISVLESKNPNGARKTVIAAVEARLVELANSGM